MNSLSYNSVDLIRSQGKLPGVFASRGYFGQSGVAMMKRFVWIMIIVAIIAGFFVYTGSIRRNQPSREADTGTLERERDAMVSDMQIRLDQFREGIEDLKKQAAQKTGEGREAVEKRIEALQNELDNARTQMENIRSSGASQWQSLVESATSAFDRVKRAYESARDELTR